MLPDRPGVTSSELVTEARLEVLEFQLNQSRDDRANFHGLLPERRIRSSFQFLAVGHMHLAQRRAALDSNSHNSVESTGLAEREGFEPPIGLHLCRISSAVHSTTLPPLQAP